MSVAVRRAVESDAPRIATLLTQLGYPQSPEWTARRVGMLGDESFVWVATDGDTVVGFLVLQVATFFHVDGAVARITSMAVDSAIRNQGIGKALVVVAQRHAEEMGCSEMEVTSSLRRSDAHAFYVALGFQETSRKFVRQL